MPTKSEIREQIRTARRAVTDRERRSATICRRLMELACWKKGVVRGVYLNVRDEVQTLPLVESLLSDRTTRSAIVVPACCGDELCLTEIVSSAELAPQTFGILEPIPAVAADRQRQVDPQTLDILLVPGLAFDRAGGRLGYGRGFYDRLLPKLRDDCCTVALAFACQLVPQVPQDEHDRPVDLIVTEDEVIDGRAEREG